MEIAEENLEDNKEDDENNEDEEINENEYSNSDENSQKQETQKQILQRIANLKYQGSKEGEILSVDDLINFAEENKLIKGSDQEVFICDTLIGNGNETPICVVFSSKTCLKFLDKAMSSQTSMLAIDATFKVNSMGYPLICIVTQDSKHGLFPIAFAPSSTESEETITFTLKATLKAYYLLYNKPVQPKYFMSDCASYIFNSAKRVFGNLIGGHLNCYFHLKENQRKKKLAEHGVTKEERKEMLNHLDIMQKMPTQEHFAQYWSLFKEKFDSYDSYHDYFEKTYIDSINNKWHYYDVEPNVFLTNNICESLNASIKKDWTNRERKPLHIFFRILKEGIIEIAKEKKISSSP